MGNEADRVITGIVQQETRLDLALMEIIDDEGISRTWVQNNIKAGLVRCNGELVTKPSLKVKKGDLLEIRLRSRISELQPADVEYSVVYYDEHLAVIDKPPNLVVHPAPSVKGLTLCHGLLKDFPQVKNVGSAERPGIVHRLDKDTSGLMLVALSEKGYAGLTKMISEKSVTRKYLVAVYGVANRPFEVDAPIGRDPRNPTRMAVVPHGKNAYTRFRPVQCLEKVSLLEAELFTGRTHQIRVHLSHAGFYVLGDPVYGNVESRLLAPRVFLHSYYLELEHPITGERLFFVSPLPEDLDECWHILGGGDVVYPTICA